MPNQTSQLKTRTMQTNHSSAEVELRETCLWHRCSGGMTRPPCHTQMSDFGAQPAQPSLQVLQAREDRDFLLQKEEYAETSKATPNGMETQ